MLHASMDTGTARENLGPKKRLGHAQSVAAQADGLPLPPPRSTSAVLVPLRRYHARSEDHRERYQLYDASAHARRSAPRGYWKSLATLLDLRIELERAMARA